MFSEEVESNVTYFWSGTNYNNDDYIVIGPESIAVRNRRTPTYFLQPGKKQMINISFKFDKYILM